MGIPNRAKTLKPMPIGNQLTEFISLKMDIPNSTHDWKVSKNLWDNIGVKHRKDVLVGHRFLHKKETYEKNFIKTHYSTRFSKVHWSVDRKKKSSESFIQTRHSNGLSKKFVGDYAVVGTIGQGAHAKVKLGINIWTGKKSALKIMDKRSKKSLLHKREALVLRALEHPGILNLEHIYESRNHIYLVLDFCPLGDLFDYTMAKNGLGREESLNMFSQIVKAVMFCHTHGILHRDIKPENVLLKNNGQVVLADFGLCGSAIRNNKTHCGSPHYVSPEICGGMHYCWKSESWSLGVLLYVMCTAKYPFQHRLMPQLLRKITLGEYAVPADMPDDIADIISILLIVDRRKRLCVHKIYMAHCFVDEDGTNLYFCREDLEWPAVEAIEPKQIKNSVIGCLNLIGFGDKENLRQYCTMKCNEIGSAHYFAQLMYKAVVRKAASIKRRDKPKQKLDLL